MLAVLVYVVCVLVRVVNDVTSAGVTMFRIVDWTVRVEEKTSDSREMTTVVMIVLVILLIRVTGGAVAKTVGVEVAVARTGIRFKSRRASVCVGTISTGSRPCNVLHVSSVEVDREVVTDVPPFCRGKSALEKMEGRKRQILRTVNRYMVLNELMGLLQSTVHRVGRP